jgi:hypothetical protein
MTGFTGGPGYWKATTDGVVVTEVSAVKVLAALAGQKKRPRKEASLPPPSLPRHPNRRRKRRIVLAAMRQGITDPAAISDLLTEAGIPHDLLLRQSERRPRSSRSSRRTAA